MSNVTFTTLSSTLPLKFLFISSFSHAHPYLSPPCAVIFPTSHWAESYYYPHFPSRVHRSVINVLISPVIPGWIGSSQHSLGNESQKVPTCIVLVYLEPYCQQHHRDRPLLVNADGLTFAWILKAPKQWADVAGDVQRAGADRYDMASWRTLQSLRTVHNDTHVQAASCIHKQTITINLNGE